MYNALQVDKPAITSSEQANLPGARHTIEVEGLSFAYPDGHPALHDISFTVGRGEKMALVGPNGAGKSTLMLHLNGILQGRGKLRVCEMEVAEPNLGKVRAAVGLVFQSPDDQLFSPTVFDDVAFGPIYQGLPEGEVRARVEKALASVHMGDYIGRVSHHLSVGEKSASPSPPSSQWTRRYLCLTSRPRALTRVPGAA
jgi:cobalt/nickel transport system ATP-binding protein